MNNWIIEDLENEIRDKKLTFEGIGNKYSQRKDLHAFILLDKIVPDNKYLISAAEHDAIYLDINIEDFISKVSKDQLMELLLFGIMYNSEYNCFIMFV